GGALRRAAPGARGGARPGRLRVDGRRPSAARPGGRRGRPARARRAPRARGAGAEGRARAGRPGAADVSHAGLLLASAGDTATGVGIPLALAAGLVSFLSPCVLPLVPGYLSTVIGVTPADLKDGELSARQVLVPSLLFIASFSAIFILLGLSATVI